MSARAVIQIADVPDRPPDGDEGLIGQMQAVDVEHADGHLR